MSEEDKIEKLPAAELEKLKNAIDSVAKKACPRCGANAFIIANGYTSLPISIEKGAISLGGKVIPCALSVCTKCGFISAHALGVLGLMAEPGEGK